MGLSWPGTLLEDSPAIAKARMPDGELEPTAGAWMELPAVEHTLKVAEACAWRTAGCLCGRLG